MWTILRNYKKNEYWCIFKDYINGPEISVLLIVIDDIWNESHDRRNAILNKDYKYIGMNYNIINGQYIAYFFHFQNEKNEYYFC